MKVYISGTFDTPVKTFIPTELYFSTEDCEDNSSINEKCFELSGQNCEAICEGLEFIARWKEANLSTPDVVYENVDVETVMKNIAGKMINNINAIGDIGFLKVKLTEVKIVDNDYETSVDISDYVGEPIEFTD